MNGNTILIEGLITSLIKNGGATPCGIFEILDQNGNVIPGTTTTPELGIPAKTHALPTASPNLKRHLDLAFNADVQQLRTNTNNNNIAANSLFNILNILDRGRTNAVYSYGHVTDKSKQLSFATEEDVVNFAKEFANLYRIMNNQNFEDFINNTINISTAFQLFGKRADYLIDPNNFRNPGYMRPISIGEDHVDYEIKLAQKNNFTPRFNFNTGNFRPRYRGELDSTYSQQSTWWQKMV